MTVTVTPWCGGDGNIYPALYGGVGLATQQQFDEVFFGVRRRKVQSCSVVLYTDIVE